MLKEFRNLEASEITRLKDALPLITILVAGADDNMDEVELTEAQRLADIRSFVNTGLLTGFYEQVAEGLAQRINALSLELPNEVVARQAEITSRLEPLNAIFAKMARPFGYLYYRDFVSFAHHIAEAHGGFMRFMTVGPKEAKVIELPMLTPVAKPSEIDYPGLP